MGTASWPIGMMMTFQLSKTQVHDGTKSSSSNTCSHWPNWRYDTMHITTDSNHLIYTLLFQEDPAAILDIKEDIREECAKIGDVTNVVLYDQEPDGVASVRYSTPEAARACVNVRRSNYCPLSWSFSLSLKTTIYVLSLIH